MYIPSSHSLSVIKNPYIVFIDNTLNQNNLNMPAIIAFAILAVKAGCLIAGSLIHEGAKFVKSLGADHKDTVRGPCLLIKDQQLGQDTSNPKESPSDALILYGSRGVVSSSSSRALTTLPNDSSARGSQDDVTDIDLFSVMMKRFNFFAFFARFISLMHALVQSALRSVVSDMKMSFALFCGSVSDNAVQKKQVTAIAFLIQVYFTRFMAKVFVILKEAVRLLKSRIEENISTLLSQLFPSGSGGSALLTDSTFVGDSISIDISTLTQKYLAMIISFVKQVIAIFLNTSTSPLGRSTRLHTTKVMTFVLLLGASISLIIGWSIPPIVFDGSNLDHLLLQPAAEVEAGSFGSVTSPFMSSLPVDTSNTLNLMESIGSFDGMSSVSMNMRTDRHVDLNHIDYPGLYSPANDFSAASMPEMQADCIWTYVSWNANESHYVQSRSGFASTLESLPLINVFEVPSEDHASNGTATEHSGGYVAAATADVDAAFLPRSISQAPHQSSVELDASPSLSAADGDTSIKLMIIFVVDPPQELFTVSRLSSKFDGCSELMQAKDRNSSMAVQMHEARTTDSDHPVLIAYDRGSFLYVWSENDFVTVLLSPSLGSFIWNHDAAAIMPLDGNIGAIHFIQSEASLLYASEDLSSDRYATNHLSADLDSPSLGLDHSLPSKTDTSSMQMITIELEPSQELLMNQNRQFGRSPTQNATIDPQLMLPAPSERTNSFEKIETSVLMNHSRRSSSRHSSLRFSTHKERHIFVELRQVALMLLMLAYHNSDGTANEPDDVALSCGPVASQDTDLELIDEESDAEFISTDGESEEELVLPGDTNTIKPSRRELMALHSDLGSHWNSPSKRRMRRSSRTRSRPQYFQPT